jgi:GNAT superfamily N-acetyltransferase
VSDDIAIRAATPDDAEAVSALLAASYPALLAGAYDPDLLARALPLMTAANPKLLASGTYQLAISNGEVVGAGGWTKERPGTGEIEPGVGHIRHFGVRADQAGKGVGRRLFDHCVADARGAGITTLESCSTLNGERFYAALGFVVVKPIDAPLSADVALPSILMRRVL